MSKPTSVTREQRVEATPERAWAFIAHPAMHERVDPRCRLLSASGADGQRGSSYVIQLKSAGGATRLDYRITSAEPGRSLVAEVTRAGRKVGEQRAEIEPDGDGARVRWTVVLLVGSLMRPLAMAWCSYQLPKWLASLKREVGQW